MTLTYNTIEKKGSRIIEVNKKTIIPYVTLLLLTPGVIAKHFFIYVFIYVNLLHTYNSFYGISKQRSISNGTYSPKINQVH